MKFKNVYFIFSEKSKFPLRTSILLRRRVILMCDGHVRRNRGGWGTCASTFNRFFFPLFNFVLVSLLCPCPTSAYPLHSQNRSFAPDGGLIDNNLDVNIHKVGRLTITTVVYYHHHYHCHHYCCYCCCCQCCCYVEMLTSIWNRPNRPTSINDYIADVWICTPNLVSVHKSFTWGRCNTEVTTRSADFRCTLWTRCDVI